MPTLSLNKLQQTIKDSDMTQLPSEIRRCAEDLVAAMWNTLNSGDFFDCEGVLKEIQEVMKVYGQGMSSSVRREVLLMECEFWIKRRRPEMLQKARQNLIELMKEDSEAEASDSAERFNNLVVFDQKIELIECQKED